MYIIAYQAHTDRYDYIHGIERYSNEIYLLTVGTSMVGGDDDKNYLTQFMVQNI